MKIVIDIDEEEFEMFKEWVADGCANIEQEIIAMGMPLPKGHGDLIDRNCFANKYESCGNEYCEHSDECEECNSRIIDKYVVDSIHAVIPADK